MDLEIVADYACETGENPLWNGEDQRLYWVDIPTGRFFRWDSATAKSELILDSAPIGGVTLQQDGAFLLFGEHGCVRRWREDEESILLESIPAEIGTRFNDAIADPQGRVFSGTMPTGDRKAKLYRFDPDGSYEVVADPIGLSNGMGFTPDLAGFYHIDTIAKTITAYDYDPSTGAIENGRVFRDFTGEMGSPDGMAVDDEGHLWIAFWGGGCVLRLDPSARIVDRLEVPTPLTSAVAFGGQDLDELFITTAGGHQREKHGPLAGALIRAKVEVSGGTRFKSRLWL